MPIIIGVLKEQLDGEMRCALAPEVAVKFTKLGASVVMEQGAGTAAGMPDDSFADVEFIVDRSAVISRSDILLCVAPPADAVTGQMKSGAVLVGFLQPHRQQQMVAALRDGKVTSFAMELIPRISRAQSMDALSSQAAIAGYKSVLIGANNLDRFFPMLTTAAGTIRPAKVLIIGAGVAGLQAIATAKRLGAIVEGYDVRGATREQIESLGAKFVDTGVSAEGEGGYARELTDEEKQKQQEVLEDHIALSDVVITTAAIPGRPAPRIIPASAVHRMKPGAVIVDIAAESGGNCELTEAGKTADINGVKIVGPVNLAAQLAFHASEMYARNLYNFLSPAINEGEMNIDWDDEVFAGAVLTHDAEIKHAATKDLLGSGSTGGDS